MYRWYMGHLRASVSPLSANLAKEKEHTSGRIDEHQYSSLCLLLCDDFSCLQEARSDFIVSPDIRYALRVWLWRVQPGHLCPKWFGVNFERALHEFLRRVL